MLLILSEIDYKQAKKKFLFVAAKKLIKMI